MALDENFDIYFNTSFGGVDVTIGGSSAIGIFSNEYVDVEIGVVPISGQKPVLRVKDSDAVGAVAGTDVVIGSNSYKVIVPQPDGTGVTDLILEKQ